MSSSDKPIKPRIKPMIILPSGDVTAEDIKILRKNGLCVVEAKEPGKIRFMDQPPLGVEVREWAAIELFRRVMRGQLSGKSFPLHRSEIATLYADILLDGFPIHHVQEIEPVRSIRK